MNGNIATNYSLYGYSKGVITINPSSSKETILLKATEGCYAGNKPTKIGLNSLSSASVSAQSMYTNSISVYSITLRAGDYGQYSLYNGEFSIDGKNFTIVNGLLTTGIIG